MIRNILFSETNTRVESNLFKNNFISANFYDAAKWVLSGYEEVQKLSKLEMDIIFMVIKVRAAQSVIGAYFTVSIEPENREYLMSEAGKAEIILNKMSLISDKTFHEKIAK